MNPLIFTRSEGSALLPLWLHTPQTEWVSYLTALLLQARAFFWLQMGVVLIGVAWCIAIASTLFFGGWYAHTHPTTGNDRVIRGLARLLWFLTFGLTDYPSSDLESEDASRESERERDVPAGPPMTC
jgi:hypothetical protein